MEVTNVILNQTGIITSTVPTTTFNSPTSGTTAEGYVGFGVSTITVTQAGAAYTYLQQLHMIKHPLSHQ